MKAQQRLKLAFTHRLSDWAADRWDGVSGGVEKQVDRVQRMRQAPDYSGAGMLGGGALGGLAGGLFGSHHAKNMWELAGGSPGAVMEETARAAGKPLSAFQRLAAALLKTPGRSALGFGGLGAGLGALALGGLGHDIGKWVSPEKKWYQR